MKIKLYLQKFLGFLFLSSVLILVFQNINLQIPSIVSASNITNIIEQSKSKSISVDTVVYKAIGYSPISNNTITFNQFETFLKKCNFRGLNEAHDMYDVIVTNDADAAIAISFFYHESSCGNNGVAVYTKSLGNIRCTSGYSCYYTNGNGSFRSYSSYTEGTVDWINLLKYYKSCGKITLEQIIPMYAPNADNNNEAAYINTVKRLADSARAS